MSSSPELTKREQWDLFSAQAQADVVDKLARLGPEIEAQTMYIDHLMATDYSVAEDHMTQVTRDLDKQWGYVGDYFLVTGSWLQPVFEQSPNGIQVEHVAAEVYARSKSNGFMVIVHEDEDGVRHSAIYMSFITMRESLSTPYLQADINLLALAEIEKVSLQYLRPSNLGVVSTSSEEIFEAMQRADSLLYIYANHYRSTFYESNARKQNNFLRQIIQIAEKPLPAPETLDAVVLEDIEVPYFYFRKPGVEKLSIANENPDEPDYKICGRLLGFTITDILADGDNTLHDDPEEFEAATEGLSLIVEPAEANFDLEVLEGSVTYIPLHAAKTMTMSVQ